MATLSENATGELQRLLQDAVIKCSERCLYQSAKWAAELLNSLPTSDVVSPSDTEVDSPMSGGTWEVPVPTGVISQNTSFREARLEAAEIDRYLLAKTYFECREFDRCAAVFLPDTFPKGEIIERSTAATKRYGPSTSKVPSKPAVPVITNPELSFKRGFPEISQKALFLALYAKYMSGEKRKDEESEMIMGPADGAATVNKELVSISQILEFRLVSVEEKGQDGQGWLEYLYGIVLAKTKNFEMAKKFLVRSIHYYPFNWGAWQELGSLIGTTDELQQLVPTLPENIMSFIFHIYANQELFQAQEQILAQLKKIKNVFPSSSFLRTQKALLYYHAKDFEKAEHIFSKIIAHDPFRIDDLDTYSNILYVMEKRPKLAFLAQLATATDKFRPETCCVVGNYYAMKSEHEKAVMYFRRALTLDRNFLAAWTLMGHEYVEMKNTHAAIECYRRAVDVNRKDYRAWYGLGQTYEVLDMHFYALFYYQRAAALCPYDPKMWAAVASCLAKMNRPAQAVKAYKRALVAGSYYDSVSGAGGPRASSFGSSTQRSAAAGASAVMDPEVLFSIACMYDRLGDRDEVQAYLELTLAQEEGVAAAPVSITTSAEGATEGSEGGKLSEQLFKASGGSASFALGTSAERFQGVGVTPTTSKARMWLARLEFTQGTHESLRRAMSLANELCQDGWEVEEAKALVRDIRAQMAWDGGGADANEWGRVDDGEAHDVY